MAGWWIPLYGSDVMAHELFHAVQDYADGLFSKPEDPVRTTLAEVSALLFGGPLIGWAALTVVLAIVLTLMYFAFAFAEYGLAWRG